MRPFGKDEGETGPADQRVRVYSLSCVFRDDIERAAKKIKILGSGFQVLSVGSKTMIQSVPCELNQDHTTVLVVAQEKFWVSATVLQQKLSWKKDRIDSVMVKEGLWVTTL